MNNGRLALVCAVWALASGGGGVVAAGLGAGAGAAGDVRLFAAPARYSVESTLLLTDAAHADVGYQLRAALDVRAAWAAPDRTEFLLHFQLVEPALLLRGAGARAEWAPRDSLWAARAHATFAAHWRRGAVLAAYLDPAQPPDLLNYHRSLISLFQFQVLDGEHNETDVSGECAALYETLSPTVFRKIKRHCVWEGAGVAGEGGAVVRRVSRYTLRAALDALSSVHAEEVVEAGAGGTRGAGVKARAWTRLELQEGAEAGGAPPPAPTLSAALHALPAALAPHALPLHPSAAGEDEPETEELEELAQLERGAGALESGAGGAALRGEAAGTGGGAGDARAALRLLPALRAAPPDTLRALLHRPDNHHLLPGLVRLLGLTGTRDAHAAAASLLQLRTEPLEPLAETYLAALALAPAPHEAVVLDVVALAAESPSARVTHAAWLAGAAAARRAGGEPLAARVRNALTRSLARCKEDECREALLLALGNLQRADTAELLLEHAERATPRPALAALTALGAAPPASLPHDRLERLARLALLPARALDVRAAALDLFVTRSAAFPLPLAGVARELHARGPHELRRVFWQRVEALCADGERGGAVRALLPRLERELVGWDAQAHSGTSSVLVREAGEGAGAWRAQLHSVQVAARGLLRRGAVRLLAIDARNASHPALDVELWTRGLGAMAGAAGGDAPGEGEEEAAGGGLALSVAGVRMRPITLFEGQAELLGLVWSGAGSEPTAVLRALVPLSAPGSSGARVPLLVGAELRVWERAAAALALDANAQVSLWSRTARARLDLRAALALETRAQVRTAWAELRAHAHADHEPRLRIDLDLDFYDAVALCVRARLEDHRLGRNVTLRSEAGARRWRVSRARTTSRARQGRTLALGRRNDAACRALPPAPSAED